MPNGRAWAREGEARLVSSVFVLCMCVCTSLSLSLCTYIYGNFNMIRYMQTCEGYVKEELLDRICSTYDKGRFVVVISP